jgi:predicted Rossmann-fold nucleotide-binding protein
MGLGWRSGGCSSRSYRRSSRSCYVYSEEKTTAETKPVVEKKAVVDKPVSEFPKIPRAKPKSLMLIGGSLEATTSLLSEKEVNDLSQMLVTEKITSIWCGFAEGVAGKLVENVLAQGGKAKAILIQNDLPPNVPKKATQVMTEDVFSRTKVLFESSKTALVLPGGYGTLSELTDLIAQRSAGLYTGAIVVYDPNDYFKKYFEFLGEIYANKAGGYPKELYVVVKNLDDLKKHIGIKSTQG